MSALEIRSLRKNYGDTAALAGVDLNVPAGAVVAVLGPSGCGKTTLLRVIAGFERPDSGEVTVDGRLVAGPGVYVPPERRRVAIVPQEVALFPHLSVAGNVAYALPRAQRRASGDRRRVEELLELVGLGGYADRRPHELSGGQQQRVAVARALAASPSLILFDEPFGSLDAALRASVRAEVLAAVRSAGATALLVTHDQQEALSVADAVAVLRAGRTAQTGSPPTLYRQPVDLAVATFVGDSVVLPGTVVGGVAECALGRLRVRPAAGVTANGDDAASAISGSGISGISGIVLLVIRPEQIDVLEQQPAGPDGGIDGAVAGIVVSRTFLGPDLLVTARLGDGTEVTARCRSDRLMEPGQRVALRCRGDVLAFPAVTGDADGSHHDADHGAAVLTGAVTMGSRPRE